MDYNFENLSSIDFERIAIDLLKITLNIHLIESFTPGPDWGIDGRFIDSFGTTNIIQCKHFKHFLNLESHLKKESKKIKKYQKEEKLPKNFNYILVTSLGLTPRNKQTIKGLIPNIKQEQDIYGRSELNTHIREYPEIEKRHFKLWLTSTDVLERIFNNDIYNQTEFEISSIKRTKDLYVETENISLAWKKLRENNFCIISGAPGVGKTTLARMLILICLSKQYKGFVISDIKEAFKVYSPKKKMVFYYDDFLGTDLLKNSLSKNEDSLLINFINTIKADQNKKFILTTREYILNQALFNYEKLNYSRLFLDNLIIKLEKYDCLHKANILFNHLRFSDIDREYLKSLKSNQKYREIVRHKSFNPRTIQFMVTKKLLEDVSYDGYGDWCIEKLNNQEEILRVPFNQQISNESKALCYLMIISRFSSYKFDQLQSYFNLFYERYCYKYHLEISSDAFRNAVKEIEDSFISLKKDKNSLTTVSFINPSVNDFLNHLIKKDGILSKNLIMSSFCPSQIQRILTIINDSGEKLLDILGNKEVQESILKLTEKEINVIDVEHNNIFSFIFNSISDKFLSSNKDFLSRLLINFINCFKSLKCFKTSSLSEYHKCLNTLEKKHELYFNKKEEVLKAAKKSFFQIFLELPILPDNSSTNGGYINASDLLLIKDFINKFPFIIDEETETKVIDKAEEALWEWLDVNRDVDNPDTIRWDADDAKKIEEAFNLKSEYSCELYELADELEQKSDYINDNNDNDYDPPTDYENSRKNLNISDNELDNMFKKL